MPLKRLTALENLRIEEERDEQAATIADLQKLLKSKDRQRTTVLQELGEAVDRFGRPRRTEIVHPDDLPVFEATEVADDVVDEACVVTLSTSGQIGRLRIDGARRATPGRHDVLVASLVTRTAERITAVTSDGRALQVLAAELGEATGRTRGGGAAQVFGTNRGESIHTVVAGGDEHLVLVTAEGVAKRLSLDEVRETKPGRTLMSLKSSDRVAAAFCTPADVDVVIIASDGQVLRTPVNGISIQGRGAGGVTGMKLRPGSTVIGAGPVLGDDLLFTIGDDCSAKATAISEFESKGRVGIGIRVGKAADGSALVLARIGQPLRLLAVMAADDNPKKADPSPVPLLLEPTRRDLSSSATERQVLDLGPARW
jgi:DNA gyrase subunit A